LEILVQQSEDENEILLPPETITVGALPERMYVSDVPIASQLERLLAWQVALGQISEGDRIALLAEELKLDDFSCMFQVARKIDEIAVELQGVCKSFAEAAEVIAESANENEASRWRVLMSLEVAFYQALEQSQRADKHAQRRSAIADGKIIPGEKHVILVGTAEIPAIVRRFLEHIPHVTTLIHAPKDLADGFSEYGCIEADWWSKQQANIPREAVRVVQKPIEQARQVFQLLIEAREIAASAGREFPADDVVVGVADSSLHPIVSSYLHSQNVVLRNAQGDEFSQTAPGELLEALASFVGSRSVPDFIALLRHPDFARVTGEEGESFKGRGELLSTLDEFQRYHLQATFSPRQKLSGPCVAEVSQVHDRVAPLISAFNQKSASVETWAGLCREFLVRVYGDQTASKSSDAGRSLFEALVIFSEALQACEDLPESLNCELSASEFFQILFFLCGTKTVPPRYEEQSVELLGWLEMQLEDAPVVVISGCNEGSMPTSITSDPFLPDAVRTKLGLQNNEAKYARDLYFSRSIFQSRPFCRFVAGRIGTDNSPMLPGRILLSCPASELAERVELFFQPSSQVGNALGGGRSSDSLLSPPKPIRCDEPVNRVAVTALRDYLQCRYRFYLKHVLKLRQQSDDCLEMDPARFGNLLHDVLNDFGARAEAESADSKKVFSCLSHLLDKRVAREFSSSCLPAVKVQIEQLRYRLQFFSRWQAGRVAEGWRIIETEFSIPNGEVELKTKSGSMTLVGRIDRIDQHEKTGVLQVVDYKTGDLAYEPEDVHGGEGEWRDLQLPAYHYVMTQLRPATVIETGYISLARDESKVGLYLSTWSDEELQDAWKCMHVIAEAIQQQEFWPPTEEVLRYDEFPFICRSGQMGALQEMIE
jgi:hypothetical protein